MWTPTMTMTGTLGTGWTGTRGERGGDSRGHHDVLMTGRVAFFLVVCPPRSLREEG
jgi:hypothetical protein